MKNYYAQKLSAERLRRCYEIAPPRVKQYLDAEIECVLDRITSSDQVLEMGCGYGRVLQALVTKARTVVGIDTSGDSLLLARYAVGSPSCYLYQMNAGRIGFCDQVFDLVICIQNGISAFKVDQHTLIREAMRVTRIGGKVVFSSYSDNFWNDRLEWFRIQSRHGLIGEIDDEASGNGVIVCKDGFRATTIGPADFASLTSDLPVSPEIFEVDGSSIFCEIPVR